MQNPVQFLRNLLNTKEKYPQVISNFCLIIGAMKSGTTALFSLLAQHPEICACNLKEPEFFKGGMKNTPIDDYYKLWDFKPRHHKFALEASTVYTKSPVYPNCPKHIADSGINARFIYIMRNPIKRMESQLKMAAKMHYKIFDNSGQFIPANYSMYHFQLNRYLPYFPAESILLLRFEDLVANQASVLKHICQFLAIDETWEFDPSRMVKHEGTIFQTDSKISMNTVLTIEQKNKLFEEIKQDMLLLERDFGFDTSGWVY